MKTECKVPHWVSRWGQRNCAWPAVLAVLASVPCLAVALLVCLFLFFFCFPRWANFSGDPAGRLSPNHQANGLHPAEAHSVYKSTSQLDSLGRVTSGRDSWGHTKRSINHSADGELRPEFQVLTISSLTQVRRVCPRVCQSHTHPL